MSKVFEYILMHPIQSVVVLVIGVSITYTTIRILKGIFGLCTRKRKARKELEKQERQAELVLEKLGGVEAFSELVAEKVVNQQRRILKEIKEEMDTIQSVDKCPIELKAYIETVLKTSPNLLLNYEELKLKYKVYSSPKVVQKAKEIKENMQDKINEQNTVKIDKQENTKEEISYV